MRGTHVHRTYRDDEEEQERDEEREYHTAPDDEVPFHVPRD
jgi:hypothetical protein